MGGLEEADDCMDEIGTLGLEECRVIAVWDGYPLFVAGSEAHVQLRLPVGWCDRVVLAADDECRGRNLGRVEFVIIVKAPEVGFDGVGLQGRCDIGIDGLLADGSRRDEVAGGIFCCVCFSHRGDVLFVFRKYLIVVESVAVKD